MTPPTTPSCPLDDASPPASLSSTRPLPSDPDAHAEHHRPGPIRAWLTTALAAAGGTRLRPVATVGQQANARICRIEDVALYMLVHRSACLLGLWRNVFSEAGRPSVVMDLTPDAMAPRHRGGATRPGLAGGQVGDASHGPVMAGYGKAVHWLCVVAGSRHEYHRIRGIGSGRRPSGGRGRGRRARRLRVKMSGRSIMSSACSVLDITS